MLPDRSSLFFAGLLVTSVLLGGCAGQSTSFEVSPEVLGTMGAAIQKRPERMEQLLEKHNLSREEFRKSVNRISENPDKAKRYRKAFEKELSSLQQSN